MKSQLIEKIIQRKILERMQAWCESVCSDGCFYPNRPCHYSVDSIS